MIVVDASVAVKWAIAEPDSSKAATLQLRELAAPSIWIAEAGNVLWRNVRLGQLTKTEAIALFGMLRAVPMSSVDMDRDAEHALALGIELGHPIYDCYYLALAIRGESDFHEPRYLLPMYLAIAPLVGLFLARARRLGARARRRRT